MDLPVFVRCQRRGQLRLHGQNDPGLIIDVVSSCVKDLTSIKLSMWHLFISHLVFHDKVVVLVLICGGSELV